MESISIALQTSSTKVRRLQPNLWKGERLRRVEFDAEEWFDKDEEALEARADQECSICFSEYSLADMLKLHCPERHSFCFECMEGSIRVAVGEGIIPKCPWEGCDHNVTEREVLCVFGESEMQAKFSRLLLRVGLATLENCVGCPTPGCENWLVLPDTEEKVRCACEACGEAFCSLCKELYHYQGQENSFLL